MSGSEIKPETPLIECGCGGKAIAWDRPNPFVENAGVISVWCSKHCGIEINKLHYGPMHPGQQKTFEKAVAKAVKCWNTALGGRR